MLHCECSYQDSSHLQNDISLSFKGQLPQYNLWFLFGLTVNNILVTIEQKRKIDACGLIYRIELNQPIC